MGHKLEVYIFPILLRGVTVTSSYAKLTHTVAGGRYTTATLYRTATPFFPGI